MFASVSSSYLFGIDGIGVEVECDVLPPSQTTTFSIVGLADSAIKESKERVKSALSNIGFTLFQRSITINLAPADLKKEGSHLDLPIAIALLKAYEVIESDLSKILFLGELSLDGKLRGVSGVLSIAEYAARNGFENIILPKDNANEAALISDIEVYPFENLNEIILFLQGVNHYEPFKLKSNPYDNPIDFKLDFKDIKGQFFARRAAEVAASGMHNFIMIGTPGSGKTMISKRLPSILPPMTLAEALETTKIHSIAGLIRDNGSLITHRPFVGPHHTASNIAIIGGGTKAKPGHVSIASNGILFLDEMLEFSRNVLEVLRQPLEDKVVTIARAGRTVTYPAKFMLVGAMNPCPCGYLGDKHKECTCSQSMIDRYRARLSGPLLDRIDLIANVENVDYKDLLNMQEGEPSVAIRQRVIEAHEIQAKRFKDEGILFNSQMTESMMNKFCKLDDEASKILENIMHKYNISARAYGKIVKTARTIADMSHSANINKKDILEAFQMKIPAAN